MKGRYDVVVVGSGFAGSIVARVLARQGLAVALLEAGRHPRFALGESSTPLAALSLERLSRRWDLPDLHALAAWGRWRIALPDLRRGLKRGFTFYRHAPGAAFDRTAEPAERLLVAASPADAIADAHWLRADVDAHLFARAGEEGVATLDEARVTGVRAGEGGLELEVVVAGGRRLRLSTELAVDATGPAGALARRLGAVAGRRSRIRSGLVFAHFEDVLALPEVLDGALPGSAPYPEERAAVHHLLAEGWLYELRFDHGVTSAGLLIEGGLARDADPETVWHGALARYPTLSRQFSRARPTRPLALAPSIQHRLDRAAGPCWVALPHTVGFVDPLFSTGIAWSLLGIERIAEVVASAPPGSPAIRDGSAFARYDGLVRQELEQIDRLVAGAYAARERFSLFVDQTMLYFTLVSYAEAEQRLAEPREPAWRGFLRADDPLWRRRFDAARERLRRPTEDHGAWVEAVTREVNIAGLCRPDGRIYDVDLDGLVAAALRLGLTADQVRRALPRLRGATAP
jgi:FADH2 O2-dependent halogenase